MHEILSVVIAWLVAVVGKMGYWGIVTLMFLESSCFPFPSEVVIIPAGFLAFKGEMNIYLIIFTGILGSILGGVFNYFIAVWLGRPLMLRFGRYMGLTEQKFKKAEDFFKAHGEISTFIGRLIPVIRQYISLPAGLSRMNLFRFCLYTSIGAGIWVAILAYIGYLVGGNEELVKQYTNSSLIILLSSSCVIIAVYVFWRRRKAA